MSDDIKAACAALSKLSHPLSIASKAIDHAPHIRFREGGYQGLFRIIIEQQVSVPSAQAILGRCNVRIPEITPEAISKMSEEQLRACGLSGPKIRYVRASAEAILEGSLDLDNLQKLDDAEAAAHMCKVKGIGPWTAAIYLLFCDKRMDIWPRGDVALLAAFAAASGFSTKPAMKDFDDGAQDWAPYRGIAAHILWTYYAKLRGRSPI